MTRTDRQAPVAIVGGGFSGTMAAANLARRGIASVLIESSGRAGLGAAYSTTEPAHLLNIPAETMGAWADSPEDFANREAVQPGSYAERRQFGRYLAGILDEAIASGNVEVVNDRAVGASRSGGKWQIDLEGSGRVTSDALVLAIGNQPPGLLAGLDTAGERVINDPWGERARTAIADAAATSADVLILGTSLTMIDVALSLEAAGHKGRTVALSRRGKLPLANGEDLPASTDWEELPPPRVRAIATWLRGLAAELGWRRAVDSLRPHSHRLWQAMPLEEKRRFLRFGRPWWDIHRHRIAPQIAERIDSLVRAGRLEVVAGRLASIRPSDGGMEATIRRRGRDEADPPQWFGYVFNCTGPLHDIARTRDPLLRQLLDADLAAPDDIGIGLDVDERARVRASERLWALGALTKGRYWEIIAVPDIRQQAADVADDIAMELSK